MVERMHGLRAACQSFPTPEVFFHGKVESVGGEHGGKLNLCVLSMQPSLGQRLPVLDNVVLSLPFQGYTFCSGIFSGDSQHKRPKTFYVRKT